MTGAAGFIGAQTAASLLARGDHVIGVDSLNDYYDPALKHARLSRLVRHPGFAFTQLDLAEAEPAIAFIRNAQPDMIIHLAAQAGVRASAERPFDYVRSNLVGHMSVLEAVRQSGSVRHLVYASSSSVYGKRTGAGPFSETDAVDDPTSLYAATKRADELMSHVYAASYGLAVTGLRFFTVYGPMGRPDMAYWSFAENILAGQPITVFDNGVLTRDFTFIDDIVRGIVAAHDRPPAGGVHRLYNIGNNQPSSVNELVAAIERALGRRAIIETLPRPSYDVEATFANIDAMQRDFGWAPETSLEDGIARFCDWFVGWRRDRTG